MPKQWRIAHYDPAHVAHLERVAGIPAVVAQLLVARGIGDPDDARQFLDPKLSGLRDPNDLPGAKAAADLLFAAIQAKRRITVYGDYDADGMTASAILLLCLRALGVEADCYVPHRIDEGYGLNCEALTKLAHRGADVVVTVDCGVASLAEADLARELGLTLIVTDHHQMAERLPNAHVVVHPGLPGGDYPFAGLCGAAVAFKLAWALCQRVCGSDRVTDRLRHFLLQAVGLAALGTVADVVPLVDENRILVRHGLNSLRSMPTAGIAALLREAGLADKQQLEGEDLAFTLAPRLNAAGRLGQAEIGVELLTTDSHARAEKLAQYLQELNAQRQTLERSITRAAEKQAREKFDCASDPALVLASDEWHPGIIGIVAGRLADKHNLPVVVLASDPLGVKSAVGSARGVAGLDLHHALSRCQDLLESHGGHAAAAGLRIAAHQIPKFRTAFCEAVRSELGTDRQAAELRIDAETALHCLTHKTVQQIESLAPFGHGNGRPVLCASRVRLAGPPKRMGGSGRHLSMTIDQGGVKLRAVAFGGGDWEESLNAVQGDLSIAFRPVINRYQGRVSVEIHLDDWRVDVVE
jgi:single-stranded-DNA-specific exonuclease